jgi:hypothetical protein
MVQTEVWIEVVCLHNDDELLLHSGDGCNCRRSNSQFSKAVLALSTNDLKLKMISKKSMTKSVLSVTDELWLYWWLYCSSLVLCTVLLKTIFKPAECLLIAYIGGIYLFFWLSDFHKTESSSLRGKIADCTFILKLSWVSFYWQMEQLLPHKFDDRYFCWPHLRWVLYFIQSEQRVKGKIFAFSSDSSP